MIRNQELFLPSHKHRSKISFLGVHGQVGFLKIVLDMSKGRESAPVDHVFLFRCTPALGDEPMSRSDDFGVKIGSQLGPIFGQVLDAEITTEEGGTEIHVLFVVRSSVQGVAPLNAEARLLTTMVTVTS